MHRVSAHVCAVLVVCVCVIVCVCDCVCVCVCVLIPLWCVSVWIEYIINV